LISKARLPNDGNIFSIAGSSARLTILLNQDGYAIVIFRVMVAVIETHYLIRVGKNWLFFFEKGVLRFDCLIKIFFSV
jgi:hypothetical protein